jgi:putative membrane protein
MKRIACYLLVTAVLSSTAFAHGGEPHDIPELFAAWSFDPLVVIGLIVSAVVYVGGILRLWSQSRTGGGISGWAATAFAAGWLSLVLALISPVHAWGEVLFSAHMTQHEILMLISAPLIVLGRPLIATMWALPSSGRGEVGSFLKTPRVERIWDFLTNAAVAWAIHAVALWVWHIPALFQATLESDFVHTLQHISFFGSALLFWWAVIYGNRGAANYGAGVLYLFTTSIHSGVLGAFLTFTRKVWYPVYSGSTGQWGLTPLEDQQLGGLIMWVPAGLVYIAAALVMFAGWLRESEKRAVLNESRFARQASGA